MESAIAFLREYSYFASAFIALAACLVGLAIFPAHRRAAFISGLAALPWAIWAFGLVPEYWTPRGVLHVGKICLEDFVWSFATGGLCWLAAAVPFRDRFSFHFSAPQCVRRYLIISVVGAAVFIPLWLGPMGVMNAFIVGNVAVGIFVASRRPDMMKQALAGAIGFGLINALVMKAALAVSPAYYDQMTPHALSGLTLWGLPVEELDWAVVTGAVWPLVVGYVFDARRENALP
jgi:hypothetical protein